jgi:nucleoside-diphosphate-sugar epimerase
MEMYYAVSKVPVKAEFVGPRIGDSRQPEKLPDCTDLVDLGWNPTYSLENAVRDSYIFYKNNPMGYKDEMVMIWNRD